MPQPRKSAFAPAYVALIKGLTERRNELGMTQAELGAAFGEDQSFVSRVERCQRRIDVYEFARLCGILKIVPSAILDDLSQPS